MIILTIISYSLLSIYEFIPLYHQKQWKDFWVNGFLWLVSLTIAVCLSFGIDIPSPSKPIEELVKSLFGRLA